MKKVVFKLFYEKYLIFLYVLVTTFLIGCNVTSNVIYNPPHENNKNPDVYFCPKDNCSSIFEHHIRAASSSVHCALYDLNLKNVIKALAEKSKFLDVRLVMDNSNLKDQIKGDGIKADSDYALMHNKFCVIDDKLVMTGSFNPTYNDNDYNSNNVVVIYSYAIAENYEDEFNELWNGKFGKGNSVKYPLVYINNITIENYFCPEDKCASRIIDLIRHAKKSVYFMDFSFTSEAIADALIRSRGLEIKGIFDSGQSSNKYSKLDRLKEFGIDVKKDSNKHKMHHKVFIIDKDTVATGSFNPTLSADTKNDENLLIIHDDNIAKDFLKEFDSLWH